MENLISVRSPKTPFSGWQVAFVSLMVLGVFFRLVNLETKVFWIDEAYTALRLSGYTEPEIFRAWLESPVTAAGGLLRYQFPDPSNSMIDTIRGLAVFEPQLPPLYFILTRGWVQLWGDSIAAIRSFGAVISIATLPMMALLSRELFPARITAYIAAALMAVSPFQVIYAQEARPYSLWTLGIVTASWALLRSLRLRTWQAWAVYAITLTLSLYTFVYTVFVLLAHGLYVVWRKRAALRPFLISSGGVVLLFTPWLWAIAVHWQTGLELTVWQRQALDQAFLALPITWALHITRNFLDFDQAYGFGLNQLWPYGWVVLVVLAGVGYSSYQLWRTTTPDTWSLLGLLGLIPALGVIAQDLLLNGQQSTVSRYFVPCWVALLLVVAYTLSHRWTERFWQWVLAGVLTLGIVSCATGSLASAWWNKTGGYIPYVGYEMSQTPDPWLITASDAWLLSLAHYLRPEVPLQIVTQFDQLPAIPTGHSHYFLYAIPNSMREAIAQYGFQVVSFEQLEAVPVWCLFPPDRPVMPCPP